VAVVVIQDVMFDPIQKRFLCPVIVILQLQPIAELVKESFFSMDACQPQCIIFIRSVDG
jgi:hypothetical protein